MRKDHRIDNGRCPDAVMTFFTYFKGRAKARRAGLCPAQVTRRDAEVTQGSGDLAGGESWRKPARGSRGRANSGAAACRALRAEAHRARRCRRLAAPAPRRRPVPPQRAHDDRARADWPGGPARAGCADRRGSGHSNGPGRRASSGAAPSSVKGTRRSFLTASQKGSSGPALERRSLCLPGGPDGKGQAGGQARSARGDLI